MFFPFPNLFAPLPQIGRQNAWVVQVHCTICLLGKCMQGTMEKHNARVYVQSTEARRESHCCEQFERRADLPEEEVDVLFLQHYELRHAFTQGIVFVIVMLW